MTTSPTPAPTPTPTPSPPPSGLKPTFEKHLDAIKWVIGLPVAVLFGTTQFVDKVDFTKHRYAGRLLLWIVLVNAGAVVLSVSYYFVAIKRADRKFLGRPDSTTLEAFASLVFFLGFGLVTVGFVLTVIGLINYPIVQFDKTAAPPAVAVVASHYAISLSGPVRDRNGIHVHTFLINETTGEVWRMDCGAPSGIQFLRVPVQDLAPPKTGSTLQAPTVRR
jgi:hypothetical protein